MDSETISRKFQKDGLVSEIRVLSQTKADSYLQKMIAFVDQYGNDSNYSYWTYFKSHLLLPWVAHIASEPTILDVVDAVIGPNLLLWNSFLPIKAPNSGGYFGWHQDGTFWDIAPLEETVTVWLALGDVNLTNGGMRMIPGSHRLGQLDHEKTFDPKSMLRRGQRTTASFDEAKAIEIPLAAGQASLHNAAVLHGSAPNQSGNWRYAVGLNYISGNVRPVNGYQDSAWLLRGKRSPIGFAIETPPTAPMSPNAFSEYNQAVKRSATRYQLN